MEENKDFDNFQNENMENSASKENDASLDNVVASDNNTQKVIKGHSKARFDRILKLLGLIKATYIKFKKWWNAQRKAVKRLIILIVSLTLVLIVGCIIFFANIGYRYNGISSNPEDLGFEKVIDKRVVNIALFGLDSRNTDGKFSFKGNSDSLMILSVNTETKKIKVISVLRDSLVPIDTENGLICAKLNSAYSRGGPELAIRTLNKNFSLDISEYATVNFYGMADIIDAVDGIDATITTDEVLSTGKNNHGINDMINEICQYQGINPEKYYIKTAGLQHLNGIQAVAYARIRYCKSVFGTTNDYGRTDRQRYVLEQLFQKAKVLSKKEYVSLAKALIPCTETSLSYSEIIDLAGTVLFGGKPQFEQYRIPQNDSKINFLMKAPKGNFGSVVYYDLSYAGKVINAVIYENMTVEEYVNRYGIEKNDWYSEIKSELYSANQTDKSNNKNSNNNQSKNSNGKDNASRLSDSSSAAHGTSSGNAEGTSSDISSGISSADATVSSVASENTDNATSNPSGGTVSGSADGNTSTDVSPTESSSQGGSDNSGVASGSDTASNTASGGENAGQGGKTENEILPTN